MSLFETSPVNLLPFDGVAFYHPDFVNFNLSQSYFQELYQSLPWQADEAIIYGKKIYTKRKIVWMNDKNQTFTYSGVSRPATKWKPMVLEIKKMIENQCDFIFNSCLLNLYEDGTQGMAWHTDKTKEFGQNTTIATLSLGASRRFDFKHIKTKYRKNVILDPGSLLIMTGQTQVYWLHQIPISTKIKTPRISLTFRQLLE